MIEIDNIKIKINEFFNKYKLQIFIVSIVIVFLLLFNYLLTLYDRDEVITTRDPFAYVMAPREKVPAKLHIETDALISKFANEAIEGNYRSAYDILSDDCKRDVFGSLSEFTRYAEINFPGGSRYDIIPYSKVGNTYVYQVKVYENFLSTGLTYSDYNYIDLKMAVNHGPKGEKLLSVAGYMGKFLLNSVFENDYIRIEIKQRKSFYSEELYYLSIMNRSEHDIILKDFSITNPEIQLSVSGDMREEMENIEKVIIPAFGSKELELGFAKFFDENSIANSIVFSAIRVVPKGMIENYKEDDVIAKFSVEVDIVE